MNVDVPPVIISSPAEIRKIQGEGCGVPASNPIQQSENTGVYIVTGTAVSSGTSGATGPSGNLFHYAIPMQGLNLQDQVNLQLLDKKMSAAAELGTILNK